MLRKKARAGIATALLATLTTLAISAPASGAKAPPEFYGVVPQTNLGSSDYDRMGAANVGTLRTIMTWASIDQSAAANDNDWSGFDGVVLESARNGVEVFPFVFGTPTWVSKLGGTNCGGKCTITAPKSAAQLEAWKNFLGEAIDRYGPNGEFWTLHPQVPKQPIGTWQVWNEQNSRSYYAPKPSPKAYAKLLAASMDAADAHDPTAEIVLGGMAELAGSHKAIPGSEYLSELYDVKGVSANFDGVAPHPYGATIAKVSAQVKTYRKVVKSAGDGAAEMFVTEVGAGSKKGGNSLNRGKKGQATLLTDMYKYFLKQRNKMNIRTVDWFSWQDSANSICSWCASSGLLTQSGQAKPSYKAFTKLTGGSGA